MKDIVYRLRDVGRREGGYTGHLQDMTWCAIIKESFLFGQDEFYSNLIIITLMCYLGNVTTVTVKLTNISYTKINNSGIRPIWHV